MCIVGYAKTKLRPERRILVAFVQCRIEGDLAREDPDVFDGVIRRTLAGAQGVRGLTKFQFESEIELRR